MLTLAGGLLAATLAAGIGAIVLYRWVTPTRLIWLPGAAHGALGITGFGALLLALRGSAADAEHFATTATVLLAAAIMAGIGVVAARWRRRRPPSFAIGVHATLAVSGLVVLAAYLYG